VTNSKEFKRTVRRSSIVEEQFKMEFGSLANLAVWLDQEEVSPVGPRGMQGTASAKQKL
jgi:hypothetical protein